MITDAYGTAEIQNYLKGALASFHRFCKGNGIVYSVWDGTLIGTIRHKGFIPWDDDVDVIFSRDNYNLFLQKYADKQPDFHVTSRLWVRRVEIDNNRWASMDGGVIDLLVFDNIPNNVFQYKLKVLFLKTLQGMMKSLKTINFHSYPPLYRPLAFITAVLGMPFSYAAKFRLYDRLSQWGNSKPTKKKGVFNEPFAYVGKIQYNNPPDEYYIKPFEDIEVMVLANYDECLTLTFGDYMTPPPEKERTAQHISIAGQE